MTEWTAPDPSLDDDARFLSDVHLEAPYAATDERGDILSLDILNEVVTIANCNNNNKNMRNIHSSSSYFFFIIIIFFYYLLPKLLLLAMIKGGKKSCVSS